MATCVNHPGVETDTPCANCGRPFCDACLVEFMGQRYCGPCRDLKLAEVQRPGAAYSGQARFAGTGTVDLGGWLSAGWRLYVANIGLFMGATALLLLLTVCTCGVLFGPLSAGMFMMCFAAMTSGRTDLAYLWRGFNRFGNAFLLFLITSLFTVGLEVVVTLAVGLPAGLLSGRNSNLDGVMGMANLGATLAESVLSWLIHAATFFSLPMIAARNVTFVEAVQASWNVFLRNPGGFLLTALVFEFIRRGGLLFARFGLALVCCGGAPLLVILCVVIPWLVAAQAHAYADHFGLDGWDQA